MKRTLLFVIVVALAGTGFAAWRGHVRAQTMEAVRIAPDVPLKLDRVTANILAHPTKVETFRLADFHEGETRPPAEQAIADSARLGTISDHTIIRKGTLQDAALAARLASALSSTVVQEPKPGQLMTIKRTGCFDPGIAFRVWKGAAHTDVCVCFYCSGADIVTKDAAHRVVWQAHPDLGPSRAALLALSVQAFPDDPHLVALRNGQPLSGVVH